MTSAEAKKVRRGTRVRVIVAGRRVETTVTAISQRGTYKPYFRTVVEPERTSYTLVELVKD